MLMDSHAHSATASMLSGVSTVQARSCLGASIVKSVSRTLANNLYTPDSIDPPLRPNFVRYFYAVYMGTGAQ